MKNSRKGIICVTGVCWLVLLTISAAAQDLHLLVLSELEERIAGKMAFLTLEREFRELGYKIVTDQDVSAIGQAVAQYSDRPHLHYSFYVIEGDLKPQALSLPGGYVLLSRSLIENVCRTEADVAFILGHEIAHSALRHYADYKLHDDQKVAYVKQLLQQQQLFPASQDQETVKASSELHQILLPYMLKIRQIKEIEADQFGALYAVRAGYPFSGGLRVLARLRQLYGDQYQLERDPLAQPEDMPSESDTHPTLSQRLEQLELFRIKAVEVAKLFPLGRDALDKGNYQEASLIFETILSLFPQSRTAHIGRGVAYHQRYWDSMPGDDFLLAYPGALEIEFMYLIERRPRDHQALRQAMTEYRTVLDFEPGNAYAHNNLGVALAELARYQEAEQVLRESLRVYQKDFVVFNLALVLRHQYLETQQTELKQEAITLMRHYLEMTPQDQVAMKYLQELE